MDFIEKSAFSIAQKLPMHSIRMLLAVYKNTIINVKKCIKKHKCYCKICIKYCLHIDKKRSKTIGRWKQRNASNRTGHKRKDRITESRRWWETAECILWYPLGASRWSVKKTSRPGRGLHVTEETVTKTVVRDCI